MAHSLPLCKSTVKGSEEIYDIVCEPCQLDGKDFPPAGYCEECQEYLCQDCVTSHKRFRLSRNHQIASGTRMPKSKPSALPPVQNDENCHLHKGENIRYFCSSDDQLCCRLCRTINHPRCDVEDISKLAMNIENSQELNSLKSDLNAVQTSYKITLQRANETSSSIETYYTNAMKELNQMRLAFEKILKSTEEEVLKIRDDSLNKIENISATSNAVIEQISKLSTELDTLSDGQNNEQLFISITKARNQQESMIANISILKVDKEECEYIFTPNIQLESLLYSLETLGEIRISTKNKTANVEQKSKSPHHVNDINVKTTSDTSGCRISSSVMLPGQRILLADNINIKLKLVDTKQCNVVSELKLSSNPWDIAAIKPDEVAVTIYNRSKIQFVNVASDTMSENRSLSVNGDCMGIDFNEKDQTLFVTYGSKNKVEILDMAGNILRTITADKNGAKLFDTPQYVTLSSDKKALYVSNCTNDTVILITLDGTIKAEYKDNQLQRPEAMYRHGTGIVYIAGYITKNVSQLIPGSNKLEPLLGPEHGVCNPLCISYCETEDKMYIGMTGDIIKVFEMK